MTFKPMKTMKQIISEYTGMTKERLAELTLDEYKLLCEFVRYVRYIERDNQLNEIKKIK